MQAIAQFPGAAPKPASHSTDADPSFWPDAVDLQALAGREPKPRNSIMEGIPCGYATGFSGHGGVGKSAIALHLAVCAAAGVEFFGLPVQQRRVLYASCEDRENDLHWRLKRICEYLRIDLADLAGHLDIIDLVGRDAVLWDRDPRSGYTVTPAFERLSERVKEYGTEFLIVDGISDTFAGDENSRTDVKRYVNALVSLIPPESGAVLMIGHVNKQTASDNRSREGYSGSTAWNNSVRARWYLRAERSNGEDGEPESTGSLLLELQKTNYGHPDLEMRFSWEASAHLFVGQAVAGASKFDQAHRDRTEREAILRAFAGCEATEAPMTIPAAMTGPRTAYHVLRARSEFPESLRTGRPSVRRFWRHIEEMRQMRLIEVSSYRRENRHLAERLAITPEGMRQCAK
jgi:RecA-family ATPase